MANNLTTANSLLQTEDSEYVRLVSLISGVWERNSRPPKPARNDKIVV